MGAASRKAFALPLGLVVILAYAATAPGRAEPVGSRVARGPSASSSLPVAERRTQEGRQKVEAPPAVPRCYPPQGETIPAAKIMRDLLDGKNVDLQGRIIEGNLDADIVGFGEDDRKTSLRIIPGRLRLDSCRVAGRIAFTRAVLLQDLTLTCSEILGDVDLTDAEIRGGFVADRSRIVGAVRIVRFRAENDLSFKEAILEESLEISGAHLHGLVLTKGEFGHDVEITRSVLSGLEFAAAKISGSMKITDTLVLRGVAGGEAIIERGVSAEGLRVAGPLNMSGSSGSGPFSFSDLSVSGQFVAQLQSATPLVLTDAHVGQIVLLDGHFGDVTMLRLRVGEASELQGARFSGKVEFEDCDFGKSFIATEALFEGSTEFLKVRFPGEDPMGGVVFTRAPVLIDTELPHPPRVLRQEDQGTQDEEQEEEPGDDDNDHGDGDAPEVDPGAARGVRGP